MGCIQSKPEKRQGLFQQQEEIIRHQGNNNKDDSNSRSAKSKTSLKILKESVLDICCQSKPYACDQRNDKATESDELRRESSQQADLES